MAFRKKDIRTEDAARADVDETFREQMYQEYGIGKPTK